jgi:hypothetical protein
MPRSPDADRELAEARAALARGDHSGAAGHIWTGAAAAASIGDGGALEELLSLADTLVPRGEAEQLQAFLRAALEDARRGTRPPSAFERLMRLDRRPR